MQCKAFRPSPALIVAVLFGALLFTLEARIADLHLWARYLLPVAVVFFWGRRRELYPVSIYLSLLMLGGFCLEAMAGTTAPLDALLNHLLPLLVLWAFTWLCVQRRTAEEAQARRQEELEAQVQARTAELAAGEQRYRLLAESANDVVWAVDMDGAMTYISPSVLCLRGFTREEMFDMTWGQRLQTGFPPELVQSIQTGLADLRASRPVALGPYTLPSGHKDGTRVWIETRLGAIYDDAGRPIGLLGTSRNVTAREKMLAALRLSEERFAKMFRSSPAGMVLGRQADSRILEANDAFLQPLGYTRDEVVGRTGVELGLLTPTSAEQLMALLTAQGRVYGLDIQLVAKDGSTVDVLYSIECGDYNGEPCYLASMVNISDRRRMERELRKSQEHFTKMFRSSPAGMSLTRRDGTYLDANDTYLAITGYTRDELIGHTSTELGIMRPATRGAQVALIDAQHEVFGHDIQIGSKGGETLDVYYSAETIDVDGEPCYLVSLVDITERKLIENELRKSAARFAKIFHASPAGIAVTRRRDAAFVETNQAFLDMVGYTHAEVIGRTAADLGFLTAEMRDEVLAAVHATDSVRGLHVPIVAPRGAIVDVLAAVEQIDFGGEPCYLLLTMDITERLQAEARIHEALARLKLATEAAGIGIWNWNFADDSLDWDERMCELYGVSPSARQEGIYYDVWRASLHPDDRDFAESTLMAAVREGSPWQIRFRLVLPDGTLRHIRTSSVVDCDRKGAPRRMIGINRDITDQVRYEQLLKETNAELEQHVAQRTADLEAALADLRRATKVKDEFLAMVSHELRTPLMGVLSMAELLEDAIAGPLNERQAKYVGGIRQSGDRLLNVVNAILSYTHLIGGRVELQGELCDLGYLLNICIAAQRTWIDAKHQALALQVAPPDLTITSDAKAIVEVTKRLLDNAVKFTSEGGQIGLEARRSPAPDAVEIVVWDTGAGIAPDQLQRIQQPFAQVDGSLARTHEGIGMGLAIVVQTVRLLGGTLAITSTPGQGSRFTMTLPARLRG